MKLSQRLGKLAPYPFVEISRIIAEKRAAGEDVVTFGIGDPDIPTPPHIIDRLVETSRVSANHRYPETDGLPQLRRAIAQWYESRFNVKLDPDKEVLPLIGAKEGVGHVAFAFLDPGDVALVPDPAYPVYAVGTMFAGAESYKMPLQEENGWLPDLDAIPPEVAGDARLMWLNYPNNPTGAVATREYLARAIEFGRNYDVPVFHDAAYSEVVFDGYRAPSFMELDGAKDVGLEFHSLSKCFNMTGWRIGMAVGNAEMVQALFQIKANLDSGIPQAIQEMAIAALTGPQDPITENNVIYQRRRDKLMAALTQLGLRVIPPKAGLYVWARVPEGNTSAEFVQRLLEERTIVVTPGSSYGQYGEGYVRFSLTTPDEMVDKGIERLSTWNIST